MLAKVDLFLKSASCLILVLVKTSVGIQISSDSCGVNTFRFLSFLRSTYSSLESIRVFQYPNFLVYILSWTCMDELLEGCVNLIISIQNGIFFKCPLFLN